MYPGCGVLGYSFVFILEFLFWFCGSRIVSEIRNLRWYSFLILNVDEIFEI